MMRQEDHGHAVELLDRWVDACEPWVIETGREMACYGPGFVHWGVQSNLKYAAVCAVLADQIDDSARAHWLTRRALACFRHGLATHVTGDQQTADGRQWGHDWISPLGLERFMHAWPLLREHADAQDHIAMRRVLTDEASWILHSYHKGEHRGVFAALWNDQGPNVPESNLWTGALLWRAAVMYPDNDKAITFADRAHDYLINAVSVPDDATDTTVLAGLPVCQRHVGANFFPHYALDHHGYMNVGYMVICTSQAAMLHFDLRQMGLERPQSLDHHQRDLWQVLRRMVLSDGRLLRIGGDSRVRYAYCQEYLLPALLYAADQLGDDQALNLLDAQWRLICHEAQMAGNGLLYGDRLDPLRCHNPHYYTRLESDRACALSMLLTYAPLCRPPTASSAPAWPAVFEQQVAGGWDEPEHGCVMHRSPHRVASFSWRAAYRPMGLCLPPDVGNLAEWDGNLVPVVRCLGDEDPLPGRQRVEDFSIHCFTGGFLTYGHMTEGVHVRVDEGAAISDQAVTFLVMAALPDERTVVLMQRTVAATDRRGWIAQLRGLHLRIPNDLFNGHQRTLYTAAGPTCVMAPATHDQVTVLEGNHVNVDDRLGVILPASETGDPPSGPLCWMQWRERGAGRYRSLRVDELCTQVVENARPMTPGEILLDTAAVILCGDARQTAATAKSLQPCRIEAGTHCLEVTGADGVLYRVQARLSAPAMTASVAWWRNGRWQNL